MRYLIGWVRFKAPDPIDHQNLICKNIQSKNKKTR